MPHTYKSSGVDMDAGDRFVEMIAPFAKSTYRPEVLAGVGPFAALFHANLKKYKDPVLVSGTDGVGTKLKVAIELGKYDTIGQDLVAMCVNDIICCGAEPLFFLDYFAVGKLKPEEHSVIVEGIANACKAVNCSLIGGETAEMPGMYRGEDFDLAGFAVGIVERSEIIDGSKISDGDIIIGVASSGLHSNGYSLFRKVIAESGIPWTYKMAGKPSILADTALEPTKLYPPLITSLLKGHREDILGIAHITGGGLEGNIPRILPKNTQAVINSSVSKIPAIFALIRENGHIPMEEMRRVFNIGIGLAIVVKEANATAVLNDINTFGESAKIIGKISTRDEKSPEIIFE